MSKKMIFFKNMMGQKKRSTFSHVNHIFKSPTLLTNRNITNNLNLLYRHLCKNKTNLVLGGDHSLSIATLSYSLRNHGNNLKVIWVDAHADINSTASSLSKNIHGMVLNYICGVEHNKPYFTFIPSRKLDLKNILYIGLRAPDTYEQSLIDKYQIQTISYDMINNHPQDAIKKTKEFIGQDKFHLSIDIDGLDPKHTPSTGTPVENGINIDGLLLLMKSLNNKNKIFTDIVEYNPNLGSVNDKIITQNNIKKLIQQV